MSLLNFVKSKTFLKQVIFTVIGLILFIVALIYWLGFTTNHNQKIQVPDLSKLTVTEVETVLEDLDLRLKVVDSSNYNPTYPPLSVIEQDPEAGDFVKENRQIYLKINRPTYKNVEIPNVLAKSRRNAEAILKAYGFRLGDKPIYVADNGKDVVRGLYHNGKAIKVGDQLPKNSVVNLKLGDGRGK